MERTARSELRWNGWGRYDHSYDLKGNDDAFWAMINEATGGGDPVHTPAPSLDDMPVTESRFTDEELEHLRSICGADWVRTDAYERVFHCVGKSYYDLLRIRCRQLPGLPDAVVYPGSADVIARLMTFAEQNNAVIIPFGGGSSVVGGVDATDPQGRRVITLDTTRLTTVLSIDKDSLLATVQSGIYGPELEKALQARGVTLGHYPQSFEFSTLGGWIAARGAGQQSNRYGTASDFLASARVITPKGLLRTLDYPQSAAGPDFNHWIAGSEGTMGVILDATVRVRPVAPHREIRAFLFPDFRRGAAAIRTIVQDGVSVSMMRLSDDEETRFYMRFSKLGKKKSVGGRLSSSVMKLTPWGKTPCLLLVGAEGSEDEVADSQKAVTRICRKQSAIALGTGPGSHWYEGRFEMPFLRDPLMDHGYGVDTFETSTRWNNINELYTRVREAVRGALRQRAGDAIVMTHISHSYQDGASLYMTYIFRRDDKDPIAQWRQLKKAASDAVIAGGGTISHHHGVGVDHLPWMSADKGPLALDALSAARRALDPSTIMNPGKLLP